MQPFGKRRLGLALATLAVAGVLWGVVRFSRRDAATLRVAVVRPTSQEAAGLAAVAVIYPLNETHFPPDLAPPTFRWQDKHPRADAWQVSVVFGEGAEELRGKVPSPAWTPTPKEWQIITSRSVEKAARFVVEGFARRDQPAKVLSRGETGFRTSPDPVGAPLFYREVNLPFIDAVKDPSRIRWRFGGVDSLQPPPVVLEGLPVCGNCHSFSADGSVLGMDVDYANSKGSYVVTRTARQMPLATSDIISWDDYQRGSGELTFGLLSQVSPDGRHVVSTVKDRSIFVPLPDLAFSQLFFPIKGILAVYNRATKTFRALPGADDPQYVQSNPMWSPDGRQIVFARARAHQLKPGVARTKLLLAPEDCEEFLKEGQSFRFDLYRIPFNDGNGGQPEPLAGASDNGFSNFFPRYSPDGRWIVFCRARNYMLLQPDSELYLLPAEGGTPRRLHGNTSRMNSWHSWSPNGRWLVFSSKANSPYTQLFLTHIDAQGESTPPVLLEHLTAPDRAANIPEFVRAAPDAVGRIQAQFVDDESLARTGYNCESLGDVPGAIRHYEAALRANPRSVHAHQRLGFLLQNTQGKGAEGLAHTLEALRLDPQDGCAHFDLGMARLDQGRLDEAVAEITESLRLLPGGFEGRYNPGDMEFNLGMALLLQGNATASAQHLERATTLKPANGRAHHCLAFALAHLGRVDEAAQRYARAIQLQPELDQTPELPDLIASVYAKAGRTAEAIGQATKALELARKSGNTELASQIKQRLEQYRRGN